MADGEKRIKELEEITALTSNDYFVVDSSASGGKTKKYKSTYITDIINNIPELVAEFEPNHYYDRDALVAHEGKVYYHNASGASYEEFPTGYQFIQIDLTGLLSRLGFGISIQHNSSFTYNKGDYCMEDYILYRCLNDNVTGAWSSSDWERASLGYDLSSIYKPRLDEHDEQIEESLALGTASGSIATFTDGSTLPMPKLEIAVEPQQDLHGYDSPWVGGAGKNKLENSAVSSTSSGVSYTVNSDTTISCSGTASATSYLTIAQNYSLKEGTYILNGCPEGGGMETMRMSLTRPGSNIAFDTGSGAEFTLDSDVNDLTLNIRIGSGQNVSGKVFIPMIRLASVTDATFAPYSNICPISGWDEANVTRTGKNLSKSQTNNSVLCSVKKGVTYTLSYEGNVGANIKKNTNSGEVVIWGPQLPLTFTADEDFNLFLNAWSANISNIQVEVGNQATTYEPYNGQTYTIDLDGTRYGGTLDVVSGVLTVDRAYVDLGTVNWDKYTNSAKTYFRTSAQLPDAKKSDSPSTTHNLICSNYKEDSWSHVIDGNGYDGNICIGWNNNAYIGIYDSRYVDVSVSDFKTAMNGVQLVYELATPQTIQLTPTEVKSLLATNNVFADTGQINDATYVRNANITINDLIRRIEALES